MFIAALFKVAKMWKQPKQNEYCDIFLNGIPLDDRKVTPTGAHNR